MIKLFLLYFIISSISHAAIISGFVYDNKTNQPIPDVNIFIPNLNIGTVSNEDGSFSLIIENKDDMRLFISHIAYVSKNIQLNKNLNEIIIMLDENFFISENIVVTGTRSNKIYKNTPIATEVITKRDIENSGSLDIEELLLSQSGISELASTHGMRTIIIQGMNLENILFLIDGQPITGKFYNRVSLDQISTNNVEKIEITKGPSSSLYGSSSMGGTINIITKPSVNVNYVKWSLGYTSPNLKKTNNVFPDGGIKYSLGGNKVFKNIIYSLNTDAEKIVSKKIIKEIKIDEINKYSINLNSIWKVNQFNDLKFNAYHYLHKEKGSEPLEIINTQIKRNNISINHGHLNNDKWNYNQIFNYQYYDRNYIDINIDQNGSNITNNLSKEHSYEYEISLNKKIGFDELNLGFELIEIKYQNYRTGNKKFSTDIISIFSQYDTEILNDYNVIIGLRFDKYSDYNIVYSPRIAIMKTLNRWKFRTSIGKGFRTPSFMERFMEFYNAGDGYYVTGNSSLLPEKSIGGTLGLEYLKPNSYQISILINHTKFTDHIVEKYQGPDTIEGIETNAYSFYNIDNTYSSLEIRGKWKASNIISASWEINFLDNRDENGTSIPNTPPLTICNGYDYKSPTHPFGLTLNTKWTQSYTPAIHDIDLGWKYDNERNPFIIVDVFGNYTINKFLIINLGFKNITNYTNNDYGPFVGKTFFIKLKSHISKNK